MKRVLSVILVAIIAPMMVTVQAGEIIQDQRTPQYGFGAQILSYSPIGQTFTAEDATIQYIGFGIYAMNSHLPVVPVTVKLLEGSGTGGTSLGVSTLLNIEPSSGFLDADFSFVTLTVGNVYTALLSTTNGRAGVSGEWWKSDIDGRVLRADPYRGGEGFNNQSQYNPGEFDLVFRVHPVPEPATLSLILLGGIALAKRRKR